MLSRILNSLIDHFRTEFRGSRAHVGINVLGYAGAISIMVFGYDGGMTLKGAMTIVFALLFLLMLALASRYVK